MLNVPEQVVATNKENLETMIAFAGIAATGAEKLIDLQLTSAKSAFEEAIKSVKAAASAKDVQQLTEIQAAIAQPVADRMVAYSRSVYAVMAETQAELSRFFEERVAEMNKNMVTTLDKVAKNAPAGSDVAMAAVKSAITAANQAYDAFSKASKQVAEATETTFTAATGATAPKKKAA